MNAALNFGSLGNDFRDLWPGILMSTVVAVAAAFIAENRGGPTLLYALLIGMALNSAAAEGTARPGIDFTARRVLRIGVALLGARITIDQIGAVGWHTGAWLIAGVVVTIAFGILAARWLGLSGRLGVLTGGATAICGASAAIAIASVLPRDETSERELIFTVAGVTALSTLGMVAYPVIVRLLGLEPRLAGIFLGATIHDVAQVVGAGYSISPEVGDVALVSKLLRVAMLLPVVMIVAFVIRHRLSRVQARTGDPLMPRFLLGFVALVVLGSLGLIPPAAGALLNEIARACLVIAIAAVGLKTSAGELRKVGARAAALLATEAAFLAGFVIVWQRLP